MPRFKRYYRPLKRVEIRAKIGQKEQLREIAEPHRQAQVQESEVNLGFGTTSGKEPGYAELQLLIRQIAGEVEAKPDRIEQLAIGLNVLVGALQEQDRRQTGMTHAPLDEHATAANIRREWAILGRQVRELGLSSKLVTRLIEGVTMYSCMASPLPAATIAGYALELTSENEAGSPPLRKDRPFGRRYVPAFTLRDVVQLPRP